MQDDLISRQAVMDEINEWIKSGEYGYTNATYYLKKRIENLQSVNPKEPKWIPVSERLPKIADVYRVTRYYPNNVMNPNYLVGACCFDGSNTWYNDNRINHERAYADNVIAWQENPEPYKAESEE